MRFYRSSFYHSVRTYVRVCMCVYLVRSTAACARMCVCTYNQLLTNSNEIYIYIYYVINILGGFTRSEHLTTLMHICIEKRTVGLTTKQNCLRTIIPTRYHKPSLSFCHLANLEFCPSTEHKPISYAIVTSALTCNQFVISGC